MKRILIVDDEPTIIASLPRALQVMCAFQGEITTAESGEEAIFKIQQCFYDICFVDVKLPDINGFVVMKRIREMYPDTNIVLMSASHVWSHMNTIIGEGEAFFIGKPFNFLQIKDILKYTFGNNGNSVREQEPGKSEQNEKRRCIRRPLMKPVSFSMSYVHHIEFKGGAIDISYRGMGMKTYYPLERGSVLAFHSGIGHKTGVVLWSEKQSLDHYRVGIKFT